MGQHGGDVFVAQAQHIRRHAEGAGPSARGRAEAAVQDHAHQIRRVIEQHGPVAGQRRVKPASPLALFAVALGALRLIDLAPVTGPRCAGWRGRRGRILRALTRPRLQVGGQGAQVFRAQVLQGVLHHLAHRAAGAGAGVLPGAQQLHDVLDGRAGQTAFTLAEQIRGVPVQARDASTRQVVHRAAGPECVARAVAGGAMAQALHQIGAPVPLGRLLRVRLKRRRLEKQAAPDGQCRLRAQRPFQGVWGRGLPGGRLSQQPGEQGIAVLAGDHAGVVVGEGRRKQSAVARAPEVQGGPEFVRAPAAQAGLGIGAQVAAVDRAKRRVDAAAAGQRHTTPCGVAGRTVAGPRQVSPLGDARGVLQVHSRAGTRGRLAAPVVPGHPGAGQQQGTQTNRQGAAPVRGALHGRPPCSSGALPQRHSVSNVAGIGAGAVGAG